MNARAIACNILFKLINTQQPLSNILTDYKKRKNLDPLVAALCFGTLRTYTKLKFISSKLLKKPIKNKEQQVLLLLLIGLYQLTDEMRIPDHAAIFETVSAAKTLKFPWAAGLINATLRSFCKQQLIIKELVQKNQEAYLLHPKWLLDKIKKYWPEQWQDIASANNQHPPLTLRVNKQKITRFNYIGLLEKEKISAAPIPCSDLPWAINVDTASEITKLPGFKQGFISIQDGAAQLAAPLLELAPKLTVLDACAAPGGKTCHLLEYEPSIQCTALDLHPKRCELIHENLTRCGLTAKVLCKDATEVQSWWDNQKFDRILLDAPCSATGIIRRHPDIKLLRKKQDIENLVMQQKNLLCNLWPLLKPNGILLYVTCSILAEENWKQIENFALNHSNITIEKIDLKFGLDKKTGHQILPDSNLQLDGFFYAKLRKNTF